MTKSPFAELSWEELSVIENKEHGLLFPAKLRRRNASGSVIEEDVCVRVPRPIDHLKARKAARDLLAKVPIDPEKDKDLLDQAEDLCLVAAAIRDTKAHGQMFDVDDFAKIDEGCIRDIKERINHFKMMLDPRGPVQTEEQFWGVVAEIWEKRNILPLADIAGHEQHSFIMRLVWEAMKSRTTSSSPASSETSTPEQ